MAKVNVNPPLFSKSKSYERYKQELQAWREITDLDKKKHGIVVALSLPEDEPIREQVFDQFELDKLNVDDGFDTLLKFLDDHLGKDELADSLEKFESFDEYMRSSETINDYVDNFDKRYNKLKKLKMTLPSEILAFKLLKCANISKQEKMLVLTGMDFSKKGELYEQAKQSLKKFKGEQASGGEYSSEKQSAIKVESDTFAAYSWSRRPYDSRGNTRGYYRGNRGAWRGASSRGRGKWESTQNKSSRPVNPPGPDGNPLRCLSCGSFRHFIAKCPDSIEASSTNITESNIVDSFNEHVVLFTGFLKSDIANLTSESKNCAVLDSACSSTVCGEVWLQGYLSSISDIDRANIVRKDSHRVFKFGGGEKLQSQGVYEIPATLAGRSVTIATDVVQSDIPLLLSLSAMKKAEMKLNLANDTAQIFGKTIPLNYTTSGHYCVPIDSSEIAIEHVNAVDLHALSDKDRYASIRKLHRQFAHPPDCKLISLLKDARVWRPEYRSIISDISIKCDTCKLFKKTPPRPVVSLPLASEFNQKVAMDLKKWNDRWILHMIDMYSRLTVSVFIDRKKPSEVIDKIMSHWVGAGYGIMQSILTDNGGEFNADEIREVASILNIETCTTAAFSPWQNGLNERIHAVTDMMLHKLVADHPEISVDVLLLWANVARNSLQMWHGYSSYQIVFGKNPNLPNVMTDGIPALSGSTSSDNLAKHLNALHAAREAFVRSEADERIRRALRSKVRATETSFETGDRVYYKRDTQVKWLGPGKVVFQDGKVIFIRHGGIFVRVSPNRVIKASCASETTPLSNSVSNPESFNPVPESSQDTVFDENSIGDITISHEQMQNDTLSPGFIPPDVGPVAQNTNTSNRDSGEVQELVKSSKSTSNPSAIRVGKNLGPVLKVGDKIEYWDGDDWNKATVKGKGGKSGGKYASWFNIRRDQDENDVCVDLQNPESWRFLCESDENAVESVNITLIPKTEHGKSDCVSAKEAELSKLDHFETYDIVPDTGQERISTTWVLWKKGQETRARLVARGFEENANIPKDSPTISKDSMRMFLTIATYNGWSVKTTDIKSAFLQGNQLDRDVYITPPKEARLESGYLWKLKKCLYGLNDAARQFYDSVVETLKMLKCQQSKHDPALFYYVVDNKLKGLIVTHIDDFLHCGEEVFDVKVMNEMRSRFVAGRLESNDFSYVGFCIKQFPKCVTLDQEDYLESIDVPSLSKHRAQMSRTDNLTSQEYTLFRGIVGKLNWISQGTRPDLVFDTVTLSMRFKSASLGDLLHAMKCLKKSVVEPSKVIFPLLSDPQSWRIIVFSDAAHANLTDGVSSMGAHVIFLVDKEKNASTISWCGNKIKRVVRSTLAAETLSLVDGVEHAIFLKEALSELLPYALPIEAIVDNRSLVEAIQSTKMVDDKRLRIDLATVKELVQNHDIAIVKWCPGQFQLANCMTKKGANSKDLLTVLQTGRVENEYV